MSGGCSYLSGGCFPVSGIPHGVHCFLWSNSHENAWPSLCSHHVQVAAACNITDSIWDTGTLTAFAKASYSFQPSWCPLLCLFPSVKSRCALLWPLLVKQCRVKDGNSFGLLRGSTTNMQISELRTMDLPTPVSWAFPCWHRHYRTLQLSHLVASAVGTGMVPIQVQNLIS